MTLTEALAVCGVLLSVVGFLLRLVWNGLIAKLTEIANSVSALDAKLDTHIAADVQAHERIAALEALPEQVKRVGDTSHRFNAANADSFRQITERFERMQMWITEKIIEALKRP